MKEYINKLMIIVLILNILLCGIITANEHHIDECQKENCSICEIIEIAIMITKYTFSLEICSIDAILIDLIILFLINYKNDILIQESLLYQKVQFNE